jgi:aminopeptidase N
MNRFTALLVGVWVVSSCGDSGGPVVVLDPYLSLLRSDIADPGKYNPQERSNMRQVRTLLTSSKALSAEWRRDIQSVSAPLAFVDSMKVSLIIDPTRRTIDGQAHVELRATGGVLSNIRFFLSAKGIDRVTTRPASSYQYADGSLTMVADKPVQVGSVWNIDIEWHDADVEQEIDLFAEGGGRVLANLISEKSTFFTYGYDYWPRPAGLPTYVGMELDVTYPNNMSLALTGKKVLTANNQNGSRTDTWLVDLPTQRSIGLGLASYKRVTGKCGDKDFEIYAILGQSIDEYPIDPDVYVDVIRSFCADFSTRFGNPKFEAIRFVGVDERFTNGFSAPGLIVVPNYTWDDDGSGSFLERDFFLAHELSHQWWGNDVLVGEPKDLWLVEGMADYVAASTLEKIQGDEAARWIWAWQVQELLKYYRAGGVDHPLVPTNTDTMQPRIYYVKGSWVLKMLETVIGKDTMADLLLEYRNSHSFIPCETRDFLDLAAEKHGQNLDFFVEQWLHGLGMLSLSSGIVDSGDGFDVTVTQSQSWSTATARYFQMPLTIQVQDGDSVFEKTVDLSERQSIFHLDR